MDRIKSILEKFLDYSVGFFMFAICFLTFVQTVSRYVLKSPFSWTPEFSVFACVWMVWMGAALAVSRKAHVKIEIISEFFNPKTAFFIEIFVDILVAVFLTGFVIVGIFVFINSLNIMFASVDFSEGYMYLSAPFTGVIMLFFTVLQIIERIKNKK